MHQDCVAELTARGKCLERMQLGFAGSVPPPPPTSLSQSPTTLVSHVYLGIGPNFTFSQDKGEEKTYHDGCGLRRTSRAS